MQSQQDRVGWYPEVPADSAFEGSAVAAAAPAVVVLAGFSATAAAAVSLLAAGAAAAAAAAAAAKGVEAAAGLVEEPGDLLLGVPEAKTSLSASLVGSA